MTRGSGNGFGRRAFLKGAVAGIAAVGIPERDSEAKTVKLKEVVRWDHVEDVVVIGYGAAGGTAEKPLDSWALEKSSHERHEKHEMVCFRGIRVHG